MQKKYVTTVNILTLADSPEEAVQIAFKKQPGPRLEDVQIPAREFTNNHNEDLRNGLIKALDDTLLLRKIVKAIALAGVVWNDPQLDRFGSMTDDGEDDYLLDAYNEGFNKGAELLGKDLEEVFQDLLKAGEQL